MDKRLLSIIIPIYNLEQYIFRCLESIICQMTKEVEIILIDDGSTDNSKTICKDYCEKYRQQIYYFYQENSGVSVARNNGLKKACGDYVFFVDGDDWVPDNSIARILQKIKDSTNIDIIAGTFAKEFNGKMIQKKIVPMQDFQKSEYPNNFIKLLETNFFCPSLWCNVFKRDLFFQNKIFLEKDVKYTEDMDCTLKLYLKSTKIDIIEEPIYVYRQGRNSATSFYNVKRVEDTMKFVVRWDERIKKIESEKLKEYLFYFIQYQYSIVVGMLFLLNKTERKILYEEVKAYEKLLEKNRGIKGQLVYLIYKIFGFNIVGILMSIWIKNKKILRR